MFRVGQKVVCVDAGGAPQLTEGAVYTVVHIDSPMPIWWRGRHRVSVSIYLHEAKASHGHCGFAPERFRPAVDKPTDISVFKNMLAPSKRELVS